MPMPGHGYAGALAQSLETAAPDPGLNSGSGAPNRSRETFKFYLPSTVDMISKLESSLSGGTNFSSQISSNSKNIFIFEVHYNASSQTVTSSATVSKSRS